MSDPISRRDFLAATGGAASVGLLASQLPAGAPAATKPSPDLPLVDYHVHLDNLGLDKALEISKQRGVKFGIVEHAGTKENKYPVLLNNDDDLKKYMAALEGKPVFKGVQAECIDWMTCFSADVVAQLDYVLTDALTFIEKDGHRVELWKKDKVKIDDKQDFMDRYVDYHVRVMKEEPIDILANPTFLPEVIAKEHEALWTPARMQKLIDAAVKYGVAIEISSSYRLPTLAFLKLAKKAGARFSFGSNILGPNVGKLDYCVEIAKELGLTKDDLFTPAPPGKKPIQVRKS